MNFGWHWAMAKYPQPPNPQGPSKGKRSSNRASLPLGAKRQHTSGCASHCTQRSESAATPEPPFGSGGSAHPRTRTYCAAPERSPSLTISNTKYIWSKGKSSSGAFTASIQRGIIPLARYLEGDHVAAVDGRSVLHDFGPAVGHKPLPRQPNILMQQFIHNAITVCRTS